MNLAGSGRLGDYFESFQHKLDRHEVFDREGVPLRRLGPPFGDEYAPVDIAQYALGCLERHGNTHVESYRERFVALARWFVHHADLLPNGAAVWWYRTPLPKWNARAPWISAMAQGQAISVLLRAHEIAGDAMFLERAIQARQTFRLSIRDGGVASQIAGTGWFYEEVAVEPPAHILNGMIYAMWALHEFSSVTKEADAQREFEAAIAVLASLLTRYDAGYWSRYSLFYPNQIASRFYHGLHVRQLSALHALTKEATIGETVTRWNGYLASPVCVARAAITHRAFRAGYLLARLRSRLRLS